MLEFLLFSYNILDIYILDPLDSFFLYTRLHLLCSNITALKTPIYFPFEKNCPDSYCLYVVTYVTYELILNTIILVL